MLRGKRSRWPGRQCNALYRCQQRTPYGPRLGVRISRDDTNAARNDRFCAAGFEPRLLSDWCNCAAASAARARNRSAQHACQCQCSVGIFGRWPPTDRGVSAQAREKAAVRRRSCCTDSTWRTSICRRCRRWDLLDRAPVFSPHVGDFMRGMLVSIPLHTGQLPGRVTGESLHAAYVDHFADEPFITVRPLNDSSALRDGTYLEPEVLNGTNRIEVFVFANDAQRAGVAGRPARQSGQRAQAAQRCRI